MRLEFDENGYVCCILYGCQSGSCVEYTGLVPTQPEAYKDIDDWADRAQTRAYKLNDEGNLIYDAERAAALVIENADPPVEETEFSHTVTEFSGTFTAYSEDMQPEVQRVDKLVQLTGACTTTSSISGSITEHEMFVLPKRFWPAKDVYQVCQGGTTRIWLLHVNTLGQVFFSRYHYSSSYDSLSSGSQLLLGAMWLSADIPVQDEDDSGETGDLVSVTYPQAAMTSDNSQSCVASASTINSDSSTFSAWKAFDNEQEAGWCHKPSDESPWIQLQMPKALKNIRVQVYSYNANLSAKGNPTSGTLMGSTDGSTWKQIGSFSGWDGSASGKLGEIVCENSEAYNYVRLNITGYTSGKAYAAIGYMTVQGGYGEQSDSTPT